MTRYRTKPNQSTINLFLASLFVFFIAPERLPADDHVRLLGDDGKVSETVLEAFLAPFEFPSRRIVHTIHGEAAAYSLDIGLSATEPFVIFQPERVEWPKIAGLELTIEDNPVSLNIASPKTTDERLDRGFSVRLVMSPLGQRFGERPCFAARLTEVAVTDASNDEVLLRWAIPEKEGAPLCKKNRKSDVPTCELDGVGLETNAMALSPDGTRLAMAFGGLRPRLELYDIAAAPHKMWQALLPKNNGGAVETGFSADGGFVVVLTGKGRMHRFDTETGGRHLKIPSAGRSARAIPPGRIMAVAGEAGEVKLWYLNDGTIAWRLPPRDSRGAVDRITASGDGSRIALLEYTDSATVVRVFEIRRRAMLRQFDLDTLGISDIALDQHGENLFFSHESRGLLTSAVAGNSAPSAISTAPAARCTGRLTWQSRKKILSCATTVGIQNLDGSGRLKGAFNTTGKADWIVAVATEGSRIAAVGDGRLLIWWLPE